MTLLSWLCPGAGQRCGRSRLVVALQQAGVPPGVPGARKAEEAPGTASAGLLEGKQEQFQSRCAGGNQV